MTIWLLSTINLIAAYARYIWAIAYFHIQIAVNLLESPPQWQEIAENPRRAMRVCDHHQRGHAGQPVF